MVRRRLTAVLVFVALAISITQLLSGVASAYHPDGRENGYACIDCHGDFRDAWTGEGPHGTYTDETAKCRMCHDLHEASSTAQLLRAVTVTDLCFTCHDNTASKGVYSQITAGAGVVAAEHSVDVTSYIPGGSTQLSEDLYCDSCHTPHRATSLGAYRRDTSKAMDTGAYSSNNLLRDDLREAPDGTYPVYGTRWCAACHDRRHSAASGVNNHPTQNDVNWGYEDVTFTVLNSSVGPPGMGFTNAGYLMSPVATPTNADGIVQNRQSPMCQQCHEDAREVDEPFETGFIVGPPLNPVYTTFPHQTTTQFMTVETADDLCLNCHATGMLP